MLLCSYALMLFMLQIVTKHSKKAKESFKPAVNHGVQNDYYFAQHRVGQGIEKGNRQNGYVVITGKIAYADCAYA